jgi:hypothetical protein
MPMGIRFGGRVMRDFLSKAEHYQKLAAKNHELAKFAQPAYLGDFYRGVAVRYAFMAQEASKLAEREVGSTASGPVRPPRETLTCSPREPETDCAPRRPG